VNGPRPIRPIDGNAMLAHLDNDAKKAALEKAQAAIENMSKTLVALPNPIPTPTVDGDAISRSELVKAIGKYKNGFFSPDTTPKAILHHCQGIAKRAPALPSIPATPALDVDVPGDAISRSRAISLVVAGTPDGLRLADVHCNAEAVVRLLQEIPALPIAPCAQPEAVDSVTAEDVVEGIEWFDGKMHHDIQQISVSGEVLIGTGTFMRHFSKKAVVAMLNVADEITFPEGHPRNPKPKTPKEPTLLEVVESILEDLADDDTPVWVTLEQERALRAAIERERKEAGE
jgi:hypothetical protein